MKVWGTQGDEVGKHTNSSRQRASFVNLPRPALCKHVFLFLTWTTAMLISGCFLSLSAAALFISSCSLHEQLDQQLFS
jgi:hypothetical protein